MVITKEDYHEFAERNAYLAAKLLTVFLEHPTIFLGYSISDKNIREVLSAMVRCLDQGQVNELSSRLFFVQYVNDHNGEPIIDKYEFEIGGLILPLTRIRTKEYKEIIEVLSGLHQKFPAALLRKIKEQIYELIKTNDPTEKIAVVDFDTDTDLEKVEFVIGVGIPHKPAKSYETYSRWDIAEDVLKNNKEFKPDELLSKMLPKLVKAKTWAPVCKYLTQLKDTSNIDPKVIAAATRPLKEWQESNPYAYKKALIAERYDSIKRVIEENDPNKAVLTILLLDPGKIDLDLLQDFLIKNFNLTQDTQYSSYFMKLLCLYDRLRYGEQ